MSGHPTLVRLAEAARADRDLLAAAVVDPDPGAGAPLGDAAAAGAGPHGEDLAFVVEAVREGYLLHHRPAQARIVATDDLDLALLAGDRLYALGLARLAELGLVDAVGELTDVIALCAGAHAAGEEELADAVWEAGVAALAHGSSDALRAAKDRARTVSPSAAGALRAAARQLPQDLAR
ncbi:hypothetical protein GKE82_15065 [Conexibacter sp. W3-3-2]|uniref:Uncharacterized protein n=1 Tax=Paraconexibacter algicola TaxID=2133960 RepID=A0A2T4UJ43_9ACTN|nr:MULTISPECIES: hypothetical protein [Solirubrobacterales]MTD45573.1 hypothetical protein [Conexibacter sp. W3-3-2]PTL59258.1 hypothetical protein C7Y72_06125 [Paraconexibacter algicola]